MNKLDKFYYNHYNNNNKFNNNRNPNIILHKNKNFLILSKTKI